MLIGTVTTLFFFFFFFFFTQTKPQPVEHASKMGDKQTRRNMRSSAGEIVEVQGGHIVRSIGRKDRHSKVCTAKGPRDRRVRLAAHTAIQFYDVQDRLGYDRPSKAVDWLINKAKAAIDDLAHLPAWHPTTDADAVDLVANNDHQTSSSFLPPSLDSDAIADTIKSFFPASAEPTSSAMHHFQSSFPTPDLLSRNTNSQDLRLSLQSFQDPVMLHHHQPQQNQSPVVLSGTPLCFDGWSEQQQQFQRLAAWNAAGDLFNVPQPPQQPMLQQLLGENQFLPQRGPLQSSNTPSIRAWIDPSAAAHHHHHHPAAVFASGFHVPARIQGDEEEHDGYSDKPSSASSDSHSRH